MLSYRTKTLGRKLVYNNDNVSALKPIFKTQIDRGNLEKLSEKTLGMHSALLFLK